MSDGIKSDTLVGGYQAPAVPYSRRTLSSVSRVSSLSAVPMRSLRPVRRAKDELDRCIFLEFDPKAKRWIDRLRPPNPSLPLPTHTVAAVPPTRTAATTQRLLLIGLLILVLPPAGVLLTWAAAEIPLPGKKGMTWLGALVLLLQAALLAMGWIYLHL